MFLGLIFVAVATQALIGSISVNQFAQTTMITSGKMLLQESSITLNRLAKDKAEAVDEYFTQFKSEVETFADYATDLFNGRINATPRRSYYGDLEVAGNSATPDLVYSARQGRLVSFNYSAYYMPFINSISEINSSVMAMVNLSANLDYIFQVLFSQNDFYIWVYMGFENGLHRTFPYKDLSSWRTLVYPDAWTGLSTTPYDPRNRQFYKDAVLTGDLSITKPYLGPTGEGLKISISHPILYDNGTRIGVIGADLTVSAIEQAVNGLQVLDQGYAFLMDRNTYAIMHRAVNRAKADQTVTRLEFSNIYSSDAQTFAGILNEMAQLRIGNSSYLKDGDKWYIAYNPVESANLSLGIVVPESDILASATEVQDQIFAAVAGQIGLFLIITIGISCVVLLFARHASRRVVDPITELTRVSDQIAHGNYRKDLSGNSGGCKEIKLLYRTFSGLVTALRFGNEEYYAGNLSRALDNYQQALELFTTLGNKKGVGICWNNIGNIYRIRGNVHDALAAYQQAIDIGETLLREATSTDEKTPLLFALAARYNNIALVYQEMGEWAKAEDSIFKALKIDYQIQNPRGCATRYGNIGQIYLAQGRFQEAKETFDWEMELAESIQNNRVLAYATRNYGLYEQALGNYLEAIAYFIKAAELAANLDLHVISTCWEKVQEIYEEMGQADLAKQVAEKLRKLRRPSTGREISFVLDYSGSMAGTRIQAAVDGIRQIFDDQLRPDDLVSLITFNYVSQKLVPLRPKHEAEQLFLKFLNQLKRPDYTTAFYDALGEALENHSQDRPLAEQWVIALTDGDDNESHVFNPLKIRQKIQECTSVNVVIIGVGDLTERKTLEGICATTDRGKYINVSHGVTNTINEAFREVNSLLAELEVEGFVPDF